MVLLAYKASGITVVRDFVRKRCPDQEGRLLEGLSPAAQSLYREALPHSWVSVELAAAIMEPAACLLYPDARDPLWQLGYETARDHLSGIYRIGLRLTTVDYVVAKAAKLWSVYHKRGKASAKRADGPRVARLEVEDYPSLPLAIRQRATGYVTAGVELTGVRSVWVVHDENEPSRWVWRVLWR